MEPGSSRREVGFSLIELVIVIAVTAVLMTVSAGFISRPLEAYNDVSERARLVGAAEAALGRMGREIRRALPNSLRVSGDAIEIYHTADGARYRDAPGYNDDTGTLHLPLFDTLEFITADTTWDIYGRFQLLPAAPTALPLGHRIVVYPYKTTTVWSDAATGANPGLVTPATTLVSIADAVDEDKIVLAVPHRFPFDSPGNRLYVVDTPISFLCSPGAGTLTRYSAYGPTSSQPTNPTAAPLNSATPALLATDVSACSFSYAPGSATRAALVTLSLTLTRGSQNVRLLHQVHVVNAP